ncbi:glycoside hydrolase family 104 protein [Flavobacterium aquidurense]|uniref:glycoside hydrolase family 24 protein n=1 Tax=Flavobacterium aquidurense TaxID=362413 RepID=UPI002856B9CB|nr:glycoside hydrolase family 104 protein [Flavobacterium aquidurense]MDR7371312.1 muramidase (phage lysozyme) [Flavobacterium aquidurense]
MPEIKIKGNLTPEVGVIETYTVEQVHDMPLPHSGAGHHTEPTPFDQEIKWFIYVLDNGNWRLSKGNEKRGTTVDYNFTQNSLRWKEMRMIVHAYGEKAMIAIKPEKASQGKILHVDLLDDNLKKPTRPFAYNDWIVARVYCVDMERFPLMVTLWEDDGEKNQQNTANIKIDAKKGAVIGGIADVKFRLDPAHKWLANARLAKGDKNEGEFHEYYVTAEIFEKVSKRVPSKNANVPNPDYKLEKPKQPTPAEQKGLSKKQEKGIAKSDQKVHDYHEQKVAVKNEISTNPVWEKINSLMTVNVGGDKWWEKKEEKKPKICEYEARVKAFMRMLRVGEGTDGEFGYTTAFDNNKITDLSSHPQKNYGGSTAAGAYQIMRYTWWWLNGEELDENNLKTGIYIEKHDYIKKYKIPDYTQESQDKVCLIIMKHKRKGLLDLIISNQIEKAIRNIASLEWASLPHIENNSKYKYKGKQQPATPMADCLKNYETFLKEELSNKQTWNLHIKNGFLKEFGYNCCDNEKDNNACSCGKTHYNNAKPENWVHQEPGECWAASVKILKNYGIEGGKRANCIVIANQKDKVLTPIDAQIGIDYIDSQLKIGNPVVVGLDDNLRETTYNVNKATDHFFVIVGSGCEDDTRFYNFFDVGSKTREKGTDSSNKLMIKDNLLIQGKSNGGTHNYTITEIRRNN